MNVDKRYAWGRSRKCHRIHIKHKVDKDLTKKDSVAMAKRLVSKYMKQKDLSVIDLDRNSKHYVYIDGPETSDLFILEIPPSRIKLLPRSCTGNEWCKYFYEYISSRDESQKLKK